MPYPGLVQDDHEILGSEYCSGYTDVFRKWNTGFYCPQTGSTSAVFCCGTPYLKYCCTTRPSLEDEDEDETAMLPYTVRIPVFFAIFCGVLAVVFLLITAVCFFCSCCFVYKKRRDEASAGLYRIQGSSSTASALANIYSNHNSSVVTTPLDTDWTSQLPTSSYIPYPFSQQSTPQLSSLSPYPSSAIMTNTNNNGTNTSNNNNNIPAFYYNNLTPHTFTNNNNTLTNSNSNSNVHFSSLSSLYQAQYHPNYQRPLSAQSSVSTYSSNSTLTLPNIQSQLPQQHQHQRPLNPNGYNILPRNQGYLYRPQVHTALPHSNNSFLQPFYFPHGAGTNGQVQPNGFNQNSRPRQLQQQQNGYQSQPPPYSNNTTTARPRTPGNQLNQEQQERLATVQSLINAYRASVNSATAAVMRSRPASFNNNDVNRLNEINSLFSAVLNQNRRVGSGGGGNGNGVIRNSGESATATDSTNMNNINTVRGSGNNNRNPGPTADSAFEVTRSAFRDANGNPNSDGSLTTVPLSVEDGKGSLGRGRDSAEPEDPDVTITIESKPDGVVETVKSEVVPVPDPCDEEPPASLCVDETEFQPIDDSTRDADGILCITQEKEEVEKICNFRKDAFTNSPTGGTRSLESVPTIKNPDENFEPVASN